MVNTICKVNFKIFDLSGKQKNNSLGICPRHAFSNSCIYLPELIVLFISEVQLNVKNFENNQRQIVLKDL